MSDTAKATQRSRLRDQIICYLLYAVLVVVAFYAAFLLWPDVVVGLLVVTVDNRYVPRAVYPFFMLLVGLGWFIFLLTALPYLRGGIERQRFWNRFARLAIPLAVIVLLGLVVQSIVVAAL